MKGIIVKVALGLVLFGGSLVGGLAATGRLNHEGTANIPLLSMFFPAPAEPETGQAQQDAAGAHPAAAGKVADADHGGTAGDPQDASQQGHSAVQDPRGEPAPPLRSKDGRSVVNPEVKPAAADGHGGEEPKDDHGKDATKPSAGHEQVAGAEQGKPDEHAAERDFRAMELSLAGDRKNKYAPGGYFTFEGIPAGLSPEQINDAWQRVQGVMADIERRKTALDVRERELQELADDIGRRQNELGREKTKVENLHRDLDRRIQKFQEQVKLVRNDEVAALRRNAQTLASFEPSKAAELVQDQWKTDRGQDEVLKTFEFMDKDAVNDVIKELPNALAQEVMKKRLRVSKEAVPAGTPAK